MKRSNLICIPLSCITAIFLIVGCKGESVDISKLVAERDSLIQNLSTKQHEIDNLNTIVQVVSDGLDSIAIQEGFIRDADLEGKGLSRSQMKKSLETLADLLARQRKRIAALEDSLNLDGDSAKGLHNIIKYLNEQLSAKEKTINQLRSELNKKNTNIAQMQTQINTLNENVEKLNKTNQIQKEILHTQDSMMNACYMKIGTKTQLKESGILTKGGILKKSKLNVNALTPDKCVKVDVRILSEIQLNSKAPKILTSMPENSYKIVQNSDGTSTLIIEEPTEFWSSSNYLVIQL